MVEYKYEIAEWKVVVRFAGEDEVVNIGLLPSFEPFRNESTECPELLVITIDQRLGFVPETECKRIRSCETGNGTIEVDQLADGGYQYLIKDIMGESCALLQCNGSFTDYRCKVMANDKSNNSFGLNNAMMLAFAFSGALQGTLLIHASLVRHQGYGYAFIAPSGTGKSTQTANWLRMIPECDLMNDDNPVLRVVDGKAVIFGSPWSGKTPCYRQVKAPLGAVTKIVRDPDNFVKPMGHIEAFKELLVSCSVMKWDNATFGGVCDTVSAVVERVGMFALHCTADPQSAVVCHQAISVKA